MIIIKVIGGLGNQMFQYATGRRLAHHQNTQLKLDPQLAGTNRDYALGEFNIIEEFATHEDIESLTAPNYSTARKFIHGLFHKKSKLATSHIRVKEPHFQKKYLESGDNVYLEGYWQSERYFSEISDIIRNELTLKSPVVGQSKIVAEEIKASNAVSLHIRRGDYVSNPKANQVHGTISLDYYHKSIDYISSKINDCHLYVFSDDPHWCEEHLETPLPATFVSHNPPEAPHEDLRLMSLCKHHIIANSTFSWWGAWLNPTPEKIVCAPQKWYASDKRRTDGLLPDNWAQL